MYPFNSRAWFLAAISIFLTITSITSQPLYNFCSKPSDEKSDPNFTSDLTSLLDTLSSKAVDNSFSNETSKALYGLFLCRGDVSAPACQNCVNNANKEIRQRCSANKTAIVWYDECMVRYSDTNFFGVAENLPKLLMYRVGTNNSEPDKPDVDAQALMYTLITDAANSNMLFKTNESPESNESLRRYGLVQCTRDINGQTCSDCLGRLMDGFKECCQGKKGWRILTPSCNLRYEDYIFYQPELTPPQPAPQPPPPPLPVDKGESKKRRFLGSNMQLKLQYYRFQK